MGKTLLSSWANSNYGLGKKSNITRSTVWHQLRVLLCSIWVDCKRFDWQPQHYALEWELIRFCWYQWHYWFCLLIWFLMDSVFDTLLLCALQNNVIGLLGDSQQNKTINKTRITNFQSSTVICTATMQLRGTKLCFLHLHIQFLQVRSINNSKFPFY